MLYVYIVSVCPALVYAWFEVQEGDTNKIKLKI
jgi:hypothetical protein